jgi:hypothetical protein
MSRLAAMAVVPGPGPTTLAAATNRLLVHGIREHLYCGPRLAWSHQAPLT